MGNCLKVVVTGEVDSGKSTLVGRILYEKGLASPGVMKEIGDMCRKSGKNFEFAYLLDSFEEERKNQMTLDSTQAFCTSKKGMDFIFIDVPGHQELIKNMLCGSSYADAAIIVVDVQKSIEEQTKRHAFILGFLGIEQIVVVFNKMDSVNFNENVFERVKKDVIECFIKIKLKPGYFIPVSAIQGDNLIKRSKKTLWYKGPLVVEVLNAYFNREESGDFRFPIQDIYNRYNVGKIAVGKIISGQVKKGEKINVLPLNKECSVKEIMQFNKKRYIAKVPESIGLILDDMQDLSRGQIICKPGLPCVTKEIPTKIFCAHSLKINEVLRLQCATQQANARITKINLVWDTSNFTPRPEGEYLKEADAAEVVITTETPVVVEKYKGLNNLGRLILQNKNKEIYAAGIIL